MIKVICFDLDGVYFTEEGKKAFHHSLVQLTNSSEKVTEALYKSPQMLEYVTGKLSESEFWSYMRSFLQLELTDEEFRQLWVKGYQIDEVVRKAVLSAKAKGFKTAICSNNNPGRIMALEKRFNFLKDFDITIFSYQVGYVKPAKQIFEALIEKSGVQPEEIVYSDDNPERLKGALDLGINAFVYTDFSGFIDQLKSLGVSLS